MAKKKIMANTVLHFRPSIESMAILREAADELHLPVTTYLRVFVDFMIKNYRADIPRGPKSIRSGKGRETSHLPDLDLARTGLVPRWP